MKIRYSFMKQREIKEKHITENENVCLWFHECNWTKFTKSTWHNLFWWCILLDFFLFLAAVVIFPGLGFPELSNLRGTFQNVMNYSKSSQLTASNTFLCLNERNIHQKILNSWGTTILGSTTTITTWNQPGWSLPPESAFWPGWRKDTHVEPK